MDPDIVAKNIFSVSKSEKQKVLSKLIHSDFRTSAGSKSMGSNAGTSEEGRKIFGPQLGRGIKAKCANHFQTLSGEETKFYQKCSP